MSKAIIMSSPYASSFSAGAKLKLKANREIKIVGQAAGIYGISFQS